MNETASQNLSSGTATGSDPLAGTAYRTLGPLGRGAMGEVVAAEHVGLAKPVVVKLLHSALTKEPELVDRMRLEAQALARLAHPNIVTVTDFGKTPGGRTYLAMERLVGATLRDTLKQSGPMPLPRALDLARQMLAGLTAAHAIRLVHRDVKLDNLFLCDPGPDGRQVLKLLDFGIAKVLDDAAEAGGPAPLNFATAEGTAMGTPRFCSPEQALGRKVDARADVYAAGAVLYHLLTGRGPFDHVKGLAEVLKAHVMMAPGPPSEHRRGIPLDLDRAVLRALEKKPDDRFPSADAFSAALGAIAEQIARPAAPSPAAPPSHAEPVATPRPSAALGPAQMAALGTEVMEPLKRPGPASLPKSTMVLDSSHSAPNPWPNAPQVALATPRRAAGMPAPGLQATAPSAHDSPSGSPSLPSPRALVPAPESTPGASPFTSLASPPSPARPQGKPASRRPAWRSPIVLAVVLVLGSAALFYAVGAWLLGAPR